MSEIEKLATHVGIVHKGNLLFQRMLSKIDSIEKSGIKIENRFIPISETYKQKFFVLINHLPKH